MHEDRPTDSSDTRGGAGQPDAHVAVQQHRHSFPALPEALLVIPLIFLFIGLLSLELLPAAGLLIAEFPGISADAREIAGTVSSVIVLALLITYILNIRKFPSEELGFGLRAAPLNILRGLLYSVIAFMLAMIVTVLLIRMLTAVLLSHGWTNARVTHFIFQSGGREREVIHGAATQLGAFRAVVVAPLLEEIIFRGMLFGSLRKFAPPWLAMIISSAAFAGLHFYIIGAPFMFVLSMVSCMAYQRHKSLAPSIAMHAFWNLRALFFVELL